MIKFLLFLFFSLFLFGQEVEIFGKRLWIDKNVTKVEDALFIDKELLLSAKEIYYFKDKQKAEAKGDVYFYYNDDSFVLSEDALFDMNISLLTLSPFFVFSEEYATWISSLNAKGDKNRYALKNILSSSCSPKDPDWKIFASSGEYDKEDKWVHLYNPTFYIYHVPVLYLPYIGFSVDTTRRSGLLKPQFGYSVNEGVLFSQPLYLIFSPKVDAEIIPTVRTKRGKGIYSKLRFVDSKDSKGTFKIGYFKDYKSYTNEFNLENITHYGFGLEYENYHLFSGFDDFYLNLNFANDTDYYYLDAYNKKFDESSSNEKIIESQVNYINRDDKNYYGLYSKFYVDTSLTSNTETFQIFPWFQYHRFNNTFLSNRLMANLDFNAISYKREKGYEFVKETLNLPFVYNFSFLDDYVKVNINEIAYFAQINNYNTSSNDSVNDAMYYSLNTLLELYTNLSKRYKTMSHHMSLNLSYYFNNITYKKNSSEYISSTDTKRHVNFKATNYLKSKKMRLYHQLSQTYYTNIASNERLANTYNTLELKYGNTVINDTNEYSHKPKRVDYNSFTFGYNNKRYEFNVSHSYKYETSQSVTGKFGYTFDKFYKNYYEVNYDLQDEGIKHMIAGIEMQKKCWTYDISLRQERVPILTQSGASHMRQYALYLEVKFEPLGGFKQYFNYKE